MASDINNNGENTTFSVVTKIKKCTSCGAELVCEPETYSLKCEHCGARYGFNSKQFTQKFNFLPSKLSSENVKNVAIVSKCLNCGAVETSESLSMSHTCSFCGSNKLTTESSDLRYSPDAIIPFSLPRDNAEAIFTKWIKKRKFVPLKFKKLSDYYSLEPRYEPCWLFDSLVYTNYSGMLEYDERVYYTDSYGRSESRVEVRKFNVSGTRTDQFNNIIVYSGNDIEQHYFNKICAFDITNIQEYADEYLAGYSSKQYTKDIKSAWSSATYSMNNTIRNNIVVSHNADRYSWLDTNLTHNNTKFAYTLLPVWEGIYTYKSKKYKVYINGTNGKCSGQVPRNKLILTILIILAIVLVFGLIYSFIRIGAGSIAGK